mmetsp:Transcript_10429/g.26235  ORF Transcript_10429/g.26235 Transcript_10429/m.26235 type:complete len:725 (-) Transcript_10429:67-2241(-)|eukprot:CAMPEP_0177651336 /NCGR_PEP_ID=MMETSP0447-20121125/12487_1 /TAXON_ID=0 /ORGANISM="Stygamoeba regulata, Strain BSH-02190019" /LENGTH=724 /DNA_ID=CAMNT_0019154397 /DNA_START=59 /DNA_END=2233 /DNA_ORIENTATION=+
MSATENAVTGEKSSAASSAYLSNTGSGVASASTVRRASIAISGPTSSSASSGGLSPFSSTGTSTAGWGEEVPLTPQTVRNLQDKLYEKRKLGALEVEQLVRSLKQSGDKQRLTASIDYIKDTFIRSSNANWRKGGLIALAAVSIGLGADTYRMMTEIIPPVLSCFSDQDSRVRYYACESMYNIARMSRRHALIFFNEIFDGMCKLSADPDLNVKKGCKLLDRLIKDIVTEGGNFDIDKFVPLLQERIYVLNAFVRQFLLGWVQVLNTVPDIDLVQHLPCFLDGLFQILSDKKRDIRREAENTIAEFLRDLKHVDPAKVDFGALTAIIVPYTSSQVEFARRLAMVWFREFIYFGKDLMLPHAPAIVGCVLPALSDEVPGIQEVAEMTNSALLQLITSTSADLPIDEVLKMITSQFLNQYIPTRLASLRWVLLLHLKSRHLLQPYLEELFPALLKTLSDPAEEVVRLDLEVMAKVTKDEEYFTLLMSSLISLFSTDRQLLDNRGSLIIRQLSLFIDGEKIYRTIASLLEEEDDTEFSSVMVQTLNLILLTARELFELRASLKQVSTSKTSRELFVTLYRSWCHNCAATFSLCLLAQEYEHACALIHQFAELEITVSFLVQIDKLVQLIESPIFVSLRLQLLEPDKYPYLFKCLYGLLMLLPQSIAYKKLKSRLNSVSTLGVLQLIPKAPKDEAREEFDYQPLLERFIEVQQLHSSWRRRVQLKGRA